MRGGMRGGSDRPPFYNDRRREGGAGYYGPGPDRRGPRPDNNHYRPKENGPNGGEQEKTERVPSTKMAETEGEGETHNPNLVHRE
jgi:hypothetical protein